MFDKKYAVIIADGSEEIEITVPTDILRRSGATCELISVNCLTVIGSHGIKITADKLIAEVDYSCLRRRYRTRRHGRSKSYSRMQASHGFYIRRV